PEPSQREFLFPRRPSSTRGSPRRSGNPTLRHGYGCPWLAQCFPAFDGDSQGRGSCSARRSPIQLVPTVRFRPFVGNPSPHPLFFARAAPSMAPPAASPDPRQALARFRVARLV